MLPVMYGLICFFVFFAMPLAYFFFEEKDDVSGVTTKQANDSSPRSRAASLHCFEVHDGNGGSSCSVDVHWVLCLDIADPGAHSL